jgi:cation diffusion facilitator CzcD-associated flavoprotein CzcO
MEYLKKNTGPYFYPATNWDARYDTLHRRYSGCLTDVLVLRQRRVFDNQNYMKCLQEDHVSLTNDPITAVKKHSILTRSGKEYPADVIVGAV